MTTPDEISEDAIKLIETLADAAINAPIRSRQYSLMEHIVLDEIPRLIAALRAERAKAGELMQFAKELERQLTKMAEDYDTKNRRVATLEQQLAEADCVITSKLDPQIRNAFIQESFDRQRTRLKARQKDQR